jgi:hypothetical protein
MQLWTEPLKRRYTAPLLSCATVWFVLSYGALLTTSFLFAYYTDGAVHMHAFKYSLNRVLAAGTDVA